MATFGLAAGTDWHQPDHLTDEDGADVDLTGATNLQCVIFTPPATAVFTLTTLAGLTVVTANQGRIQYNLTAAQSTNMDGDYRYETTATLASGDVVVLAQGDLHIRQSFIGG